METTYYQFFKILPNNFEEEAMKVGEFFREKRMEKDLGQRGLASICKCSAMQIHRIESGKNLPSIPIILLFCEFFQIPFYDVVKYILPLEDMEKRFCMEKQQGGLWKTLYLPYKELSFEQIVESYLKNSIKIHKAKECNCSATQLIRLASGERHLPKNVLLLWHLANGLNLPIGFLLEKEYPNIQVDYKGFHFAKRDYLSFEEAI